MESSATSITYKTDARDRPLTAVRVHRAAGDPRRGWLTADGWTVPIEWQAATLTPLYHGVELSRGAVLGTLSAWNAVGHIAVLVAFAVVGYVISRHYFARRLTT